MTYLAPSNQYYDFTHMYNIQDIRGQLPIKISCPGSLLYILEHEPDFKYFYNLVKKADLEGVYNNIQADFTIFVPSDSFLEMRGINEGYFVNMDKNTAINIVQASTLPNKIPSELLEYSRAIYFYSIDKINRLFISNDASKNTKINNIIHVIKKDIMATNGILHVVDGLINPFEN